MNDQKELKDKVDESITETKTTEEMAQETENFAKQHNLDQKLQDLMRKASKVNAKYPLHFIADEIYKTFDTPPENKELVELREKVYNFQALLEHMKNRGRSEQEKDASLDEQRYQDYSEKHELRRHRVELIAVAYMADAENPLLFIANYIIRQPDSKIIAKREIEDLEKRSQIYQNLIQKLTDENPMTLEEIAAFSKKTVLNKK